eukprot:351528_1
MSIKHMTSMMPRALHNTGSIRPNAISSHPKRQCRSHAFTDNVDPTHSPVDDSDYRRNVHHDDPTHYSPPMPDLTPSLIVADYLNHRIQMMCHTMTSSAYIDTMMCHTATLIAPHAVIDSRRLSQSSHPNDVPHNDIFGVHRHNDVPHSDIDRTRPNNIVSIAPAIPRIHHTKHATSCIVIAPKTCNFLHPYRTQNAIHRLMLPSDQYSRFIG